MSKYLKIKIDPEQLLGVCLGAIQKREAITINATAQEKTQPTTPDYAGKYGVVAWVEESKYN